MTHSKLRPPPALAGLPRLLASRACWPPALAGLPRLLASRACWPPALAGLPRFLAQALPVVSLIFLAMTIGSLPAHAGHWLLTTTGSGKAAVNGTGFAQTFTAPPPTTGSVSIGQLATSYGNGPTFSGNGPTLTAAANLSVTVTGTWTNDTNSDNTAPPSILYSVSSTANASSNTNGGPVQPGTANDGYGDGAPSGSPIGTSATPGIKYVSGSGSFTVSLTLSASASGNAGPNGGGGANASVGPITIGVHAQPYNFHQTSGRANADATLSFAYAWLSTSGNLSGLTSCSLHEIVTYPGSANPYVAPLPFTQSAPNPTISPVPGIPMTSTVNNGDTHYVWSTSSNYNSFVSVTVSASQKYVFNDSATNETDVLVPGPDSTQTITRTIYPVGSPPYLPDWWYSITKNGVSASTKVISHP